jgi:hypothetical protein
MSKKYFIEKTIKEFKWENIPTGLSFTCKMNGEKLKGQIYNDKDEGFIYLCNNTITYDDAPSNLGYKGGIEFPYGDAENDFMLDDECGITNLEFGDIPKGFEPPIIINIDGEHLVQYEKGFIVVGCQEIDNEQVEALVKALKPKKKTT